MEDGKGEIWDPLWTEERPYRKERKMFTVTQSSNPHSGCFFFSLKPGSSLFENFPANRGKRSQGLTGFTASHELTPHECEREKERDA